MSSPEELFQEGRQAARRHAWPEALSAYERALAADPSHWKARFGCGLARQTLGDQPGAIADFNKVLAVHGELPEAWYCRAVSEHLLNDFHAALQDCEAALARRPDYTDALYLRAVCLRKLGRPDDAIRDLERLLVLDRTYSEGHRVRASIALERGDVWLAKSHFDAYLAANPTDHDALFLRGVAAIHAEDYSDAVEFLSRAITLAPNLAHAYARRSQALDALGRKAEAAEDIARCKSLLQR